MINNKISCPVRTKDKSPSMSNYLQCYYFLKVSSTVISGVKTLERMFGTVDHTKICFSLCCYVRISFPSSWTNVGTLNTWRVFRKHLSLGGGGGVVLLCCESRLVGRG
jgi:hypothetical protein